MKLLQICSESNWDYYLTDNNKVLSIPKIGKKYNGCKSSFFGNKKHMIKNINFNIKFNLNNDFNGFTKEGLEFFNGLTQDVHSKYFYISK